MSALVFNRDAIRAFHFVRCTFNHETGIAQLVYAFDGGQELVETITFPGAPFHLNAQRTRAIEQALRLLHLIAGVSYYKAAVPPEIRIDGYEVDEATAVLLEDIYVKGLGEFAYRNGLNLHGRVKFPRRGISSEAATKPSPSRGGLGGDGVRHVAEHHPHPSPPLEGEGERPRALVAIGGGKDSLVSIEALRAIGVEQTVSWIGGSQLIKACAERTGLPTLNIGRQLAPELFEYNRHGAWNGHIPVTAINSAILVFAALLLGVNQVVFSNERSASYGSLIEGTGEVNHQWSKSWTFERAFGDYVQTHLAPDLHYYSLLRPLSELAVARQFAKTDHYDAHFSSCNRNFHLLGERPANRWCGVCPKCHFVFLALAPFMPKPRLVGIFGRNLLDDAAQTPGYDGLLEYQDHKPFECVGEGKESRAAMAALAHRPEWREDAIVERFAREIKPQLADGEVSVAALMALDDEHRIPALLWDKLRALLAD